MGTTPETTQTKKPKEELKRFYFNFAFQPHRFNSKSSKESLERMADCLMVVVEARTYQGATVKGRQLQMFYSSWQVKWELTDVYWVPAVSSHGAVRRPVRVRPATNSRPWRLLKDSDSTDD